MTTGTRTANSAPSAEVSATVSSERLGHGVVVAVCRRGQVPRLPRHGGRRQSKYIDTTASSFAYKGSGEIVRHAGVERHQVGGQEHAGAEERPAGDASTATCSRTAGRQGRTGYAIVLTPRNSGRAPWTRVQDVTFTNNIVRHVAGVVNIAGFDDSDPTQRTERDHVPQQPVRRRRITRRTAPSAKAMLVGDGAREPGVRSQHDHPHQQLGPLCLRRRHAGARLHEQHLAAPSLRDHGRRRDDRASRRSPSTSPAACVRCNVLAGGTASLYPTPNAFPTVSAVERLVRRCRRPETTG